MMAHGNFDVFLSHSGDDKPTIELIARRLIADGLKPWLDQWNLIPGEPWQPALEDALQRSATCAIFIGTSGLGPWQHEEMRAAIDRRVGQSDFRVIPVLLPGAERGERSQLPTFLLANAWVEFPPYPQDDEEAFRRLACGIRGVSPGPRADAIAHEGECPYRGLQLFDVPDSRFFFGRESITQWLLAALRPSRRGQGRNRFLVITGASGSGKSSLARAGLLAALKRGAFEGSQDWLQVVFRPGANPLESLAIAAADTFRISEAGVITEWVRELHEDHRSLHLRTRLLLRHASENQRLTLLVDQFEEVFTVCHDELHRQAFIDNLLYAVSVVGGQTVIVLTMRADFLGKCASHPALASVLSAHQELIGPMSDTELREAVERPA